MPFAAAQGSLWTRPSGQVGWPFAIDWSHGEAVGLTECIVAAPMGMIDLVSGRIGARVGSADPGWKADGGYTAAYFSGVTDQYGFPADYLVDTSAPFAIVWQGQVEGFIDSTGAISIFPSTGGGGLRLMVRLAGNAIYLIDGASTLGTFSTPAGVSILDMIWGVWSYSPALGHELFVNGQPCQAIAPQASATRANVRTVGGTSNTGNDFFGSIRQIRLYSRGWGLEEAQQFSDPATRDGLYVDSSIRPAGAFGIRLYGDGFGDASGSGQPQVGIAAGGSGAGAASGGAGPQVGIPLTADGFAVAGGSAHLSSSIPPTMVADSRYTVRAPIRDYRVAMPQRNRVS